MIPPERVGGCSEQDINSFINFTLRPLVIMPSYVCVLVEVINTSGMVLLY